MSSQERRLELAMVGLTAKERALLMLRDFKAGKSQNRELMRSAPQNQTNGLNRLIGLMNGANGDLALLIAYLHAKVEQEVLRFSWLEWARMCALEMWAVRAHLVTSLAEPITESGWKVKEAEARAEMMPIKECAEMVAEYYHAYDESEFETDEEGHKSPSDDAWYRVRDEALADLKAGAADGTLQTTGKGSRLKIACGSFYDRIGEEVIVAPDFGWEYQVLPDHRQHDVERMLGDHTFIRELLDRGACKLDLPLDVESPLKGPTPGGFGVETARLVAVALRAVIQELWRELRAMEERIDAITEEFDGEDALHPLPRERLTAAKASLLELHASLQKYTGPFELPAPDAETRDRIERIVEREARNVPTR